MVKVCPMGLDSIGQLSGWVLDEDVVPLEAKPAIGSLANAGHVVVAVVAVVAVVCNVEIVWETFIPDFLGDISGRFMLSRDAGFLPDETT